jgi:hypothetical protein
MSKSLFFKIASQNDVEVEYEPKARTGEPAIINIYSPIGKVFCTSGCHSDCSIQDLTDNGSVDWLKATESLKAILQLGFYDCLDPDCDFCSSVHGS